MTTALESRQAYQREVVVIDEGDRSGVTLAEVARFVIRHFVIFALVPFTMAVAGLIYAVVVGRTFTAYSAVLPEYMASGGGAFSALASRFGVSLPDPSSGGTAAFYAGFLKEHSTLRTLANTRFDFNDETGRKTGTWIELNKIEAPTEHRRQLLAIRALQSAVRTSITLETGVLEIHTDASWHALSELMNRRLLTLMDEFNLERRRVYAAAEREFIEARLAESLSDLRRAETTLERFLETNRTYQSSPQLTFEAGRLQRTVELRQQLYVSLAQAFEDARLEEIRKTPQITLLTAPEGTAERSRLLPMIIAGGSLGILLAILIAFWREWLSKTGQSSRQAIRGIWQSADNLPSDDRKTD
jgi:hypothetical protein